MDRRILLIALLVFALGAAWIGYQQYTAPPIYHGTYLDPGQPAAGFTLQSDQGPVRLSDFRGQYVMVYFGYTFCPDVCPTTLSTVKKAVERAGKAAEQFQFVFISVDPRRDTPERLGEYSRYFNPDFIGVTGSEEEIAKTAGDFHIHYYLNDSESLENYTVDHTSVVQVIDPAGNLVLIWPHDATSQDMAADIKSLARNK
ncbi:MAG: SCO family protein [Chloroflexi bacterium]|nr:SCO family protein [Chloroflexota bacterium]